MALKRETRGVYDTWPIIDKLIHRADGELGFYGTTPIVQQSDASQVAVTDSTGGAVSDTMAAGVGVTSVMLSLGDLDDEGAGGFGVTTAGDVVTDYVPGFKFKILNLDFITDTPGTGAGATAPVAVHIGATAVTSCVCTVTLSSTDTRGKLTAGVAATALNTGSATATISLNKGTSTAFTAGSGYFLLSIQNMDLADAFASMADKSNEVRSSLVNLGLITGAA